MSLAGGSGERYGKSPLSEIVSGVLAGAQVKLFAYDPNTAQPVEKFEHRADR